MSRMTGEAHGKEKKKTAADATENENEKQLSAKPTDDSDGGGLLINEDIGYDD